MSLAEVIMAVPLVLAGLAFVLSLMAGPEPVRQIMAQYPLTLIQRPFTLWRDACRTILDRARSYTLKAAASVGISGNHAVQRLVGCILLSLTAAVAFYVDYLLAKETFAGVLGSPTDGPASLGIESMAALSLVASLFVWGALLMDSVRLTHITVFSSDTLPKSLRYSVIGLCLGGFLMSAFMLAALGLVRFDAVATPVAFVEAIASDGSAQVETINEAPRTSMPTGSKIQPDALLSDQSTASLPPSVRTVMVGIPVVSSLSGLLSAVAFIPAGAVAIGVPFWLALGVIVGIPWTFSVLMTNLLDVVYNLVLTYVNIFVSLGVSLRNRFGRRPLPSATEIPEMEPQPEMQNVPNRSGQPDNGPPSETARGESPNHQSNDQVESSAPDQAQTQGAPAPQEPLYAQDDPNWNPLGS